MSEDVVYIDLRPNPAPKWPQMPDIDAIYDCAICDEARPWGKWLAAGVAICIRCQTAALAARDAESAGTLTATTHAR